MSETKTPTWETVKPLAPKAEHILKISDEGTVKVFKSNATDKWFLWSLHSGGVFEESTEPPFDRAIDLAIERAETYLAKLNACREAAEQRKAARGSEAPSG